MMMPLLLVALLGLLVLLQLALALGAPWGELAWGGGTPGVLPKKQRIASAVSVVVLLVASLFVFDLAGVIQFAPNWLSILVAWALFVAFFVSTGLNWFSKSKTERRVMAPVSLLYTVVAYAVAFGGPVPQVYSGTVIDSGDGAYWCETVMESYPPQCGGEAPLIHGWDWSVVDHEEANGVLFGAYEFEAVKDGDRMQVAGTVIPLS